jgi:hypothetical protein
MGEVRKTRGLHKIKNYTSYPSKSIAKRHFLVKLSFSSYDKMAGGRKEL